MASASDMIKRFREGRPTSRVEREKERHDGKVNEMWWLPKDDNTNNNSRGEGPKNENNYEPHYEHRYPSRDNNNNSYRDNDIRGSNTFDDDNRPQTRGDRRPLGGAMKSRNDHLRSLDLGSSWGSLGEEFMTSTGRDMVDRDVGRGIRVGTKGISDKSKWFEKRPGQMQEPNIDNSNEFQPMWRMRGRDGPGDSLRLDKYKPAGDEFGRQSMEDMLRSSGSTGLKGLLMKELKLDTRTKEGSKDKKRDNDNDYDYDDYNYNYNTFDNNKSTAEVSATVRSELNDLLKSLQDADQLKMKEMSDKKKGNDNDNNTNAYRNGEQRTSIIDVANRLDAEMKGFKILFDEKKDGTFSEKSQKERDDQMREAGKLEALSTLDDLIDRGSYRQPNSYNNNNRNYPINQNVLHGIDMNVGMVQLAIDKEIMAAKDTLQQMYMIKRNLARGLNQADNYQSVENSNRDRRRDDRSSRDRDRDRDSHRGRDKDRVRDQENSYQRKEYNDSYRPQSVTTVTQNIETTLDEVILSLKARLSKPLVTSTELLDTTTKPSPATTSADVMKPVDIEPADIKHVDMKPTEVKPIVIKFAEVNITEQPEIKQSLTAPAEKPVEQTEMKPTSALPAGI